MVQMDDVHGRRTAIMRPSDRLAVLRGSARSSQRGSSGEHVDQGWEGAVCLLFLRGCCPSTRPRSPWRSRRGPPSPLWPSRRRWVTRRWRASARSTGSTPFLSYHLLRHPRLIAPPRRRRRRRPPHPFYTGIAAMGVTVASTDQVSLAGLTALMVGIILVLARLLRLGFLANFLSRGRAHRLPHRRRHPGRHGPAPTACSASANRVRYDDPRSSSRPCRTSPRRNPGGLAISIGLWVLILGVGADQPPHPGGPHRSHLIVIPRAISASTPGTFFAASRRALRPPRSAYPRASSTRRTSHLSCPRASCRRHPGPERRDLARLRRQ